MRDIQALTKQIQQSSVDINTLDLELQLRLMQEELMALVQHVYELGQIHIQRVWRGIIARRQTTRLLESWTIAGLHAAATQVQCM